MFADERFDYYFISTGNKMITEQSSQTVMLGNLLLVFSKKNYK